MLFTVKSIRTTANTYLYEKRTSVQTIIGVRCPSIREVWTNDQAYKKGWQYKAKE